jgi:hypothetical protein
VRESKLILRPSSSWLRDRNIALEEDIIDKLAGIAEEKTENNQNPKVA